MTPRSASITLALVAPLTLWACSSSTDEVSATALLEGVPSATSAGVSVNGELVPDIVLERELVYRKGAVLLESRKLDALIQEEIRRQLEDEGLDEDFFALDEAEVEKATQEALDQIQQQYPDLDPKAVLGSNGLDHGSFGDQVAQTKLFDAVFLPDNPDEWPQVTVDIMMESGGEPLIEQLRESYERRQDADTPPAEAAAGEGLWQSLMRSMVIQGLNKTTLVKTAADGLSPDLVMTVNGAEITTDEMYDRVVKLCTEEDFRRTRQWVAKVTAVRQDLEQKGAFLNDEEFAAAFAEHEKPYVGTAFPLRVIAMGTMRFPSMDSYRSHFRLLESYRRMIEDELDDAALNGHMPRANQMLGNAVVDAEVILCSAFDFQMNAFEENGWENAAARAEEVVRKLADSEGEAWDELLVEYSGFWDPPSPANPQAPAPQQQQKKNKGRFGPLNRYEMIQRMGESNYDAFLFGALVSDHVFFDQGVGTVEGPFRGPHGFYITRVKSRSQPTRPSLSLADESHREQIEEDYLSCRFNQYARGIAESAVLVGM